MVFDPRFIRMVGDERRVELRLEVWDEDPSLLASFGVNEDPLAQGNDFLGQYTLNVKDLMDNKRGEIDAWYPLDRSDDKRKNKFLDKQFPEGGSLEGKLGKVHLKIKMEHPRAAHKVTLDEWEEQSVLRDSLEHDSLGCTVNIT